MAHSNRLMQIYWGSRYGIFKQTHADLLGKQVWHTLTDSCKCTGEAGVAYGSTYGQSLFYKERREKTTEHAGKRINGVTPAGETGSWYDLVRLMQICRGKKYNTLK